MEEKDQVKIIDLFTSLQGEGKYAGVPSIFIRTSGCNLRCVFRDSICDTPYSSYNPEESNFTMKDIKKMIDKNPKINHIVVTGGEPLMWGEKLEKMLREIKDYAQHIHSRGICITIETNGTFPPIKDPGIVDLYSVSPKLSTSIAKPGQVVKTPQGDKKFTKEEVEHLNKARINWPNLAKIYHDAWDIQLKFVYSGKESLKEIFEYIDKLAEETGEHKEDINRCIMLMPEGMTEEILTKNRKEAANECIKNGWRYTDRLHITIWGDKRGF